MNKILQDITKQMYKTDLDYVNIRKGNYKVVRDKNCIKHYYYGNLICYVNIIQKQFFLHDCKYSNCRLTTAQLNWLEKFYKEKDYILLYRGN